MNKFWKQTQVVSLLLLFLFMGILFKNKYVVFNSYNLSFMDESFNQVKRLDDLNERSLASIKGNNIVFENKIDNKLILSESTIVPISKTEVPSITNEEEIVDIQKSYKLTSIFDLKKYGKILDNRDSDGEESKFYGEVSFNDNKLSSLYFDLPEIYEGQLTGSTKRINLTDIKEMSDGISFQYSINGQEFFTGIISKSVDEVSLTFSQAGPFQGLKLSFFTEQKLIEEMDRKYEYESKVGVEVFEQDNSSEITKQENIDSTNQNLDIIPEDPSSQFQYDELKERVQDGIGPIENSIQKNDELNQITNQAIESLNSFNFSQNNNEYEQVSSNQE